MLPLIYVCDHLAGYVDHNTGIVLALFDQCLFVASDLTGRGNVSTKYVLPPAPATHHL